METEPFCSPDISLQAQVVRLLDRLGSLRARPLGRRALLKVPTWRSQVVPGPHDGSALPNSRFRRAVARVLHRAGRLEVVLLADDGGPLARLPLVRHLGRTHTDCIDNQIKVTAISGRTCSVAIWRNFSGV